MFLSLAVVIGAPSVIGLRPNIREWHERLPISYLTGMEFDPLQPEES